MSIAYDFGLDAPSTTGPAVGPGSKRAHALPSPVLGPLLAGVATVHHNDILVASHVWPMTQPLENIGYIHPFSSQVHLLTTHSRYQELAQTALFNPVWLPQAGMLGVSQLTPYGVVGGGTVGLDPSTNGSFTVATMVQPDARTFDVDFVAWAEVRVDPLAGFEKYESPNWDGEGADAIESATAVYARWLLSVMPTVFGPPDIAPSANGSIDLEWVLEEGPLHKLFLDIGPELKWNAYWRFRNGEFGRANGEGYDPTTKNILEFLFSRLGA